MKSEVNIDAVNKYKEMRQILLDLYENRDLSGEAKVNQYNSYLIGIRSLAYNGNPEAQFDLAGHYGAETRLH
jgi:hypothetical protein